VNHYSYFARERRLVHSVLIYINYNRALGFKRFLSLWTLSIEFAKQCTGTANLYILGNCQRTTCVPCIQHQFDSGLSKRLANMIIGIGSSKVMTSASISCIGIIRWYKG
jgi:hypothetical protein